MVSAPRNNPVRFEGKPALALTPPMGWNSWNCFRCYDIDETKLLEVADAMVDSGLLKAGFNTFVIDDCWQALSRDDLGKLRSHPARFPSGMQWIGEQLKERGFKFGLYASPGRKTCAMIYDRYPGHDLGSFGREQLDADTFAAWGVDFLKYDWCEADEDGTGLRYPEAFERMALALENTGREIVYSISEYGRTEPWTWAGEFGHMWRTTPDIEKNWASVLSIADHQAAISAFSGPGAWNDPDMLQVGNPGLSARESATHFALWCFFAAPLMAGHDPRAMSTATQRLLTNAALIAINQDALGVGAVRQQHASGLDLWTRPLSAGRGWLLVNRSEDAIVLSCRRDALWVGEEVLAELGAGPVRIPVDGGEPAGLESGRDWILEPHGCFIVSAADSPG
ncbi:glycoside hydrolase family 27 protein [Arthrobacter sp. H35-D1]|uniref:glycoside hydrolase family 27 protein n=1 Tax=Arthrobacter sp. H35-D1 TaxID=3046202 RepID=UPI0024B89404|nr:glycoside hydrolase family 27 protein [Arthrobacter sp. H35-D1]MDJ0313459.1 glycoside hydrolase family 27 protein [Arthrobacter sp. H35-D1]